MSRRPLLSTKDLAEMYCLKWRTLIARMRNDPAAPKPVFERARKQRMPAYYYDRQELIAWHEAWCKSRGL